jgi:hypothetical protein
MKGPLFARPNLKGIVLAALLVAVVQHLVVTGRSEPPKASARLANPAYRVSTDEIQDLLTYAVEHPSAEAYRRASLGYERRGEIRKALLLLREAEKIEEESFD